MKCAVVFILLAGFLWGCEQRPRYYIGVVNKTGHDLQNVKVVFSGKQQAQPGGLVKDGCATEGPVTAQIPSEAEVRLGEHVVKAKLQGVVPAGFTEGTIYFVLGPNNSLQVKTAKLDDIDANAAITK